MRSLGYKLLFTVAGAMLLSPQASELTQPKIASAATCERSPQDFLVFGGGGAPSYNEIAIEKNVLYFQRTLSTLGYNPAIAPVFFANGTDGKATIRYIDLQGKEQFKAPDIPHLKGAATLDNLQTSMQQTARHSGSNPLFFYFTGHGHIDRDNPDNNILLLWNEQPLNVQQFTQMLDKLPAKMPVVTMMSQCYSGSFANLIYQGGDPKAPVTLRTRCGFFATIKTRPSVGCTPAVNEADYKDYSSSFFAGLSGRNRVGQPVASADYNKDGKISYAEAHAFAKVDEQTSDLPISTSEAWLQRQVSSRKMRDMFLAQPIASLSQVARPEQRYVLTNLAQRFGFNTRQSFLENVRTLADSKLRTEEDQAYLTRLAMELVNVGMEQRLRQLKNPTTISTLDRLIRCESGVWGNP